MRSLFTKQETRAVSSRGFDLVYKCSSDMETGEVDRLRDLYVEVYGEKIGKSALITAFSAGLTAPWNWKFNCDNRRPAEVVLAYQSSRLIGHVAVLPHKAVFMGEEVYVGQGLDSMISPDYQKQGLFGEMSRFLYQHLSPDISTMYAFPNINNYIPRIRLGWRPIYEIPWYEKEVHARQFSRRISLVDTIDARLDALWERVASRFSYSLARDASYLNWRFVDNPLEDYRIVLAKDGDSVEGYAIWKNYFGQGQIVDTLAVDVETQAELLSAVESILCGDGVRSLALFVPRDWVLLTAAIGSGMKPASKGTYLMTYPNQGVPAGLYVQMGDNDIF
jgi:hypothetical protein